MLSKVQDKYFVPLNTKVVCNDQRPLVSLLLAHLKYQNLTTLGIVVDKY